MSWVYLGAISFSMLGYMENKKHYSLCALYQIYSAGALVCQKWRKFRSHANVDEYGTATRKACLLLWGDILLHYDYIKIDFGN